MSKVAANPEEREQTMRKGRTQVLLTFFEFWVTTQVFSELMVFQFYDLETSFCFLKSKCPLMGVIESALLFFSC